MHDPAPETKVYSFAANLPVINLVPEGVVRVLDIGCGSGENSSELRKRSANRWIAGVTYSEPEAAIARKVLDEVVVADAETWNPPEGWGKFDCILMIHVLEHLRDPQKLLLRASDWLAPGGRVVLAVPNVLHVEQRIRFLFGQFRYTDVGIMDNTHLRFFDHFSLRKMVRESGYRLERDVASGLFPMGEVRWRLPAMAAFIDSLAEKAASSVFAWQFVVVAAPLSR